MKRDAKNAERIYLNNNKWCVWHKTDSHNTKECRYLILNKNEYENSKEQKNNKVDTFYKKQEKKNRDKK